MLEGMEAKVGNVDPLAQRTHKRFSILIKPFGPLALFSIPAFMPEHQRLCLIPLGIAAAENVVKLLGHRDLSGCLMIAPLLSRV